MSSSLLTVGIAQVAPVFSDLSASLDRAHDAVAEAAQQGVSLLSLGETWLPGYPAWLDHCPDVARWDHAPTKEVFARLRNNSVTVPGPAVERLSVMARDHSMVLVVGVNERVDGARGHGTLYNSLLTFDAAGELVNHHRKLVPTYTERLVWGPGDATGLQSVDTNVGRVGGLICWEHWMPMARQAMHDSGEQIHVAAWPTVHEMHQVASRHYAFEGRCFVLASGAVLRAGDLPDELELPAELREAPDTLVLRGGSAVYGPRGNAIAGPVFDEETLLVAEIDPSEIDRESMTLDVSGHYSRPDVFSFDVKRQRP